MKNLLIILTIGQLITSATLAIGAEPKYPVSQTIVVFDGAIVVKDGEQHKNLYDVYIQTNDMSLLSNNTACYLGDPFAAFKALSYTIKQAEQNFSEFMIRYLSPARVGDTVFVWEEKGPYHAVTRRQIKIHACE
ncbi:MAG: hypothetical protein AABZ06_00830 [Bdellovibrionota bacterium]